MGNILRVSHIFQLILQQYERFSQSNHYAHLGNALQKHFFAYSALIMGTLKGSTGRFFDFSVQSQNFK